MVSVRRERIGVCRKETEGGSGKKTIEFDERTGKKGERAIFHPKYVIISKFPL